jgi:predicted enzyme related to lactoylglutathione lyase
MANLVVWVDIPVLDLDRAMRFYSAVLASEVRLQENHGMKIGLLPGSEPDVFGLLFAKESEQPSDKGPVVYLSVEGRLDDAVAQVEAHGGKVLQARHQLGPYGFRAVILDSEGNRIALHSM